MSPALVFSAVAPRGVTDDAEAQADEDEFDVDVKGAEIEVHGGRISENNFNAKAAFPAI